MKAICKNCKYWSSIRSPYEDKNGNNTGSCSNKKFIYAIDDKKIDSDGLRYWDAEAYYAYFETGLNFGCIHFEKKELE